jgi:hypothetical protein
VFNQSSMENSQCMSRQQEALDPRERRYIFQNPENKKHCFGQPRPRPSRWGPGDPRGKTRLQYGGARLHTDDRRRSVHARVACKGMMGLWSRQGRGLSGGLDREPRRWPHRDFRRLPDPPRARLNLRLRQTTTGPNRQVVNAASSA